MEIMRKSTLAERKFWAGIICVQRFKTVWQIMQCCLTSKGYKGFELAYLRILCGIYCISLPPVIAEVVKVILVKLKKK